MQWQLRREETEKEKVLFNANKKEYDQFRKNVKKNGVKISEQINHWVKQYNLNAS